MAATPTQDPTKDASHSGVVPTLPDPESDCPLTKLYRKRVAQNRDLTVLIGDWNLERGSGKTTLALRLAAACDRTDEGMTPDKATLSAEELTRAYTSHPVGSSLVLDEGEAAASNRQHMSGVKQALREIVGMGRVEQKYLFLTAPGIHQVDKDIRNMCDLWIFVREVGQSQMFRVRYNPFRGHELTDDWGTLRWKADLPGDLKRTYDQLTAEKRRRLRGDDGDGAAYVPPQEAKDREKKAAEKAERQTRDQLIRDLYRNTDGLTQQKLADGINLSRSRVADIVSDT